MAIEYALLKGKVIGGVRAEVVEQQAHDEGFAEPSWVSNHYHILIQAEGGVWRCPVNVRSQDNSEIWLKVEDAFSNHPILEGLPGLPEGLRELPQRRPGLTLDYVREPLFDRTTMRHLPKHAPGEENDAQDLIELYVNQAQADPGAIAYIFGSFWLNRQFPPDRVLNTRQGVHDIHMNQGNSQNFRDDDGVYQDGGIIFHFAQSDRFVGIFLAFNSQVWHTNSENGHRLPGFAEGPLADVGAPPVTPPTPVQPPVQPLPTIPAVRIIAALANPAGDDVSKETVVLFNATLEPLNLDGWKLQDRNNKVESLSGIQVDASDSVIIHLSGQGVQLGNRGGAIRLIDHNNQLVDVATYDQAQAVSGRIITF